MDESDVITLAQDLIRIDSSNYGDAEGPGEREAAEYVAAYLSDLGLNPVLRESRASSHEPHGSVGGRGPHTAAARCSRPPRRRPCVCRGLDRGSLCRRDSRRDDLGARRGRHEGHRRDVSRGRRAPDPRRAASPPATSCLLSSPTRSTGERGAPSGSPVSTATTSTARARRSARLAGFRSTCAAAACI